MSTAFARFWQTDLTREAFLDQVKQDELCSLRLVCRELAADVAIKLFKTVTTHFSATTFSHRSSLLALERIGHYIKHFQFHLPLSASVILPPLIDPETLEEVQFQYEPRDLHASRPSSSSSDSSTHCKYGSWETNDLLVRQYPPLFHAATNITSFMRAINAMPMLRHITIVCPEQLTRAVRRRSTVEYALISLRLALEAVNPPFLDKLDLDTIHPSAIFYLRPHQGIATSPASTRIWHRIKHLSIKMQNSASTEEDESTTDHLKILHTYLQGFRALESLSFTWLGQAGPCPLSLHVEPCTIRPSSLDSITSTLPPCRPIRLRKLKTLMLENAVLDASQASRLITLHRKCIRDIDFSSCTLRSGTWDDALAPLETMASNSDWRSESSSSSHASTASSYGGEVMEVPIVYSPVEEIPNPMECIIEPLWDQTDKDVMRGIDKVAKDVFKLRDSVLSRRKRHIIASGVRSLLRGMRIY